ncbi:protein kintoun [Labrus bergylta]|uniref:protein kintoun n=1 Tax=Labrus bergylta TaxID=56723 RepID=UPI003313E799
MEVGDKLKELNMTVDEIDTMAKAFKDKKFREMLRDYAEELADPENRKMYEEEIKLLEQERGNTVEFIHPEPFRAIRTSLNGKQKCFINICGSDKVGKPECKVGTSPGGRRGQCWSLPHSLHPGRENTDAEEKKIMTYDVVFHPDTLHIASKNKRFMDMVESTAIEGIQNTFKVTLDKNNVREMTKIKYKGTPQPCVVRKPTPGHQRKEASEKPDPLAFPYPDEKRTASSLASLTDSHITNETKSKRFQMQPQKTKEPTKPNYTVKYRSFIDLQDFRNSRDSAQSPRPKEIVVTIDMPLLKAVTDASLEVTEKQLLLESKEPAYRLELPLAYPVDEDKGEAKFNKQKGQLTVTLPVLPSDEAFEFTLGLHQSSVGEQEEESEVEKEREVQKSEEDEQGDEGKVKEDLIKEFDESKDGENLQNMQQHKCNNKLGEDGCDTDSEERGSKVEKEDKWEEKEREVQKGDREEQRSAEGKVEEERDTTKEVEEEKMEFNESEDRKNLQKMERHEKKFGCDTESEEKDSGVTSFQGITVNHCMDISSEKGENPHFASPITENKTVLITAYHSNLRVKEEEVDPESTLKMKTSEIPVETELDEETTEGNQKDETDAAIVQHSSCDRSQAAVVSSIAAHRHNIKDDCISQKTEKSSKMLATQEANGSGKGVSLSEGLSTSSVQQEEKMIIDEDDLPTEEIFPKAEHKVSEPPPVLLRETDEHGNEKVISDHSTSAGFFFENSLMFELD